MPTVYQRSQKIPELKGHVRGGLAVVVHSPHEVSGLQRLIAMTAVLPGDGLTNAYHVIANAGDELAKWPEFAPRPTRHETRTTVREEVEGMLDVPDAKVAALQASLALAEQMWSSQKDDAAELALAVALPQPGRRLRFESKRPSLMLDYGSIRARLLTANARLREFGVALFPVARSRRQVNLTEALRANAVGTRLPRLESIRPADLDRKSGIVIFLHGLFSTDVGTFDAFIGALRSVDRQSLLLVSWPHDTLDPIELNAEQLSEIIESRLGASSLPIAFVCHSRGGLVARRTVVELLETNTQWQRRLRGCVTFGTPHDGAELAEVADELLGRLLFLGMMARQSGFVPLVDALWAVHDRRKLPGITDLRPRKNGGDFLRRLRKDEGRLVKKAGAAPMSMFAVGGNAQTDGGVIGWATRRFFGGTPHDLVVTVPSSIPSEWTPTAETTCDHFGYFSPAEMKKEHARAAVQFLQRLFYAADPAKRRERAGRHLERELRTANARRASA